VERSAASSIELERRTSAEQDAVRLLVVLGAAGGPVGDDAPAGAVAELRAESRLHALDFWLRNPDYLGYELLNQYRDGSAGGSPGTFPQGDSYASSHRSARGIDTGSGKASRCRLPRTSTVV
jgi:hypothetical protein